MRRCMRWLGLSMILATALSRPSGSARAGPTSPPPPPRHRRLPRPTRRPPRSSPTRRARRTRGPIPTGRLTGEKDANTGKIKVTQETLTADVKNLKIGMNMVWTLITGFLVMFMQAGFALLETGLTRAKNVAHTMAMNFVIYAIGMHRVLDLRLRLHVRRDRAALDPGWAEHPGQDVDGDPLREAVRSARLQGLLPRRPRQ